jgi:hypothetical protein
MEEEPSRQMALGGTMRRFAVLLLLVSGACSPAAQMLHQVQMTGVSYDTVKDPKVAGKYEARASLDPKRTADTGDVGIQALQNGVEAAQKDGYDLVTYTGPSRAKLTMTRTYRGASTVQAEYPAIVFYVQGYKATEAHPPNARPAASIMAAITADREKHEAGRNAVQSVVSSPD